MEGCCLRILRRAAEINHGATIDVSLIHAKAVKRSDPGFTARLGLAQDALAFNARCLLSVSRNSRSLRHCDVCEMINQRHLHSCFVLDMAMEACSAHDAKALASR